MPSLCFFTPEVDSFVKLPAAPAFWPLAQLASFFVPPRRRPRAPRPPRARARALAPDATWQRLAGRLELASDLGRQAARLSRSRDPAALDAALDAWREAVLDAIEFYNATDEFAVAQ